MINEFGEIKGSDGNILIRAWEVSIPAGKRGTRLHSHIRFEITLINEGTGTYLINGKEHKIKKGEIFIIASNEQHCVTNVENGGLKMTNLHFEPRCLWGRSYDSLTDENINFCFSHNKNFDNRIPCGKANNLTRIICEITEEFKNRNKEYRLKIKSLLNLMLIMLIRDHGYSKDTVSLKKDRFNCIRNAIKYIDSHLSEPISLEKLSELSGMSPNYFSALFHNVSGITLWDYYNSRRIDNAIFLLKEKNEQNILDIALACGFNNTANFNKAFKKATGTTPSKYRNSDDILL